MQIDVAELPEFVLDNAAFLLTHRQRTAVQLIASQHPVDRHRRRYRVASFPQDGMDLIAVHPPLAVGDDLSLDPFRLTPFPPFWAASARQKVRLIAALQIAIVILAEGLRAGPVVAVEIPNSLEQLAIARPSPLHIPGSETATSAGSCVQSSGRSCCRASDRPPEERSNQRISEHAQLRERIVRRRREKFSVIASEASEKFSFPREAIQRARSAQTKNSALAAGAALLFGALRAQLDCFASLAMT